MGCFGSRVAFFRSCTLSRSSSSSRQSSRRQNTFAVQNVDDTGQGVSPGKLEVTETDLVLHVKGKPSLTWPLRSLRRYGFDNDLFSFESGRRCPTGAGIFAFRCHRAQSLFNLLQAKIQGNPASLPTLPNTPITPPNTNSATAASTPASSTFVYVNLSESNSSRLLASSGAPVISHHPKPNPLHATTSTGSGVEPPDVVQMPTASKSSEPSRGPVLRITTSKQPSASVSENHPVYMNVESHGGALYAASSSSSTKISNNPNIPPPTAPRKNINMTSKAGGAASGTKPSDCALYSNVICNHKGTTTCTSSSSVTYVTAGTSKSSSSGTGAEAGPTVVPLPDDDSVELNYAELDLKTDDYSPRNSPHSGRSGDAAAKRDFSFPRLTPRQQQNNGEIGYATIDFDKTAQLSVVTRSKITLNFEDDTPPTTKKSRVGTAGL